MSNKYLLLIVVILSVASFFCRSEERGSKKDIKPGNIELGKQIYKDYCSSCHGNYRKVLGPSIEELRSMDSTYFYEYIKINDHHKGVDDTSFNYSYRFDTLISDVEMRSLIHYIKNANLVVP